jgi:NADH:ubiquinone oxidoreductase subunit K
VITALMLLALVVNIIRLEASNDTTSGQIISTVFKIVIESSYVVGLALRFSYCLSLNKSYKKKNAK